MSDLHEAKTFRFAHAMLRVKDLDKALDFYVGQLGMQVLRQKDYPDGKFTNTFLGYGEEGSNTVLELTHNWHQAKDYDHGTAFGHLALEVADVYATCEALSQAGVKIVRPAGPMKYGKRVIAFIQDPDGYKIELLQPLEN